MENNKPHIIRFKENPDSRGTLTPIESNRDIPFEIKRVFYTYDLNEKSIRADHVNTKLQVVIICLAGSFTIELTDVYGNVTDWRMTKRNEGLYVPKMIWKKIYDFEPGSIIMVIADEYYDPEEIIWDKAEFLSMKE